MWGCGSPALWWPEAPVSEGALGLSQEDMSRQEEGVQPAGNLPFFHWICQPYVRPG